MEVEWDENCREPKVERIVPVYHKTDVLCLQAFLREKFNVWAGNGSSVEEIRKRYKDIVLEGTKRYAAQTVVSNNPDPEYCNKEGKRLKVKVRKMYSKRKFGQPYQADLKRLCRELLVAKKKAHETFLRSVLQKEGRCWTSSISMLNDVKEIEQIFRLLRTIMAGSSQIQQKRPTP